MSNSPIHRVLYRALVRVARRHDVEPELKALLPAVRRATVYDRAAQAWVPFGVRERAAAVAADPIGALLEQRAAPLFSGRTLYGPRDGAPTLADAVRRGYREAAAAAAKTAQSGEAWRRSGLPTGMAR